jgi:methyl-accepting chemotaxis protein
MIKEQRSILLTLLMAFIVPPLAWLLSCWYVELWSFDECLKIAIGPQIWLYVIPYLILVVYSSKKHLDKIGKYIKNNNQENLEAALGNVAFLPKFFLGILLIYCIVGPAASMISKPFIDKTEWWLCASLGLSVFLLFSVPLIIKSIYKLESYAKSVPLSSKYKPISLSGRFTVVFAFTLFGSLFTLLILGLSLLYANSETPANELFYTFFYKSIALVIVEITMCIINMSIILRVMSKIINGIVNFTDNVARDASTQEHLETISRDNLGQLSYFLNRMLDKLNDGKRKNEIADKHINTVVDEVKVTSNTIADSIFQISEKINESSNEANNLKNNMQYISSASEQSRSNMNSVSAAVEELSSTTNEIASNTERTKVISSEAVTLTDEALDNVKNLQTNSGKISEVVDIINEIADQTELLALNATIEAARAGDSGKGFAVVASEIKELAKKTSESVTEIQSVIDSMQTSTTDTVTKIQDINKVIVNMNEIIMGISAAIEEQNVTTIDITENIVETNQGVADTTANVKSANDICNKIAINLNKLTASVDTIGEVVKSLNDTAQSLEK